MVSLPARAVRGLRKGDHALAGGARELRFLSWRRISWRRHRRSAGSSSKRWPARRWPNVEAIVSGWRRGRPSRRVRRRRCACPPGGGLEANAIARTCVVGAALLGERTDEETGRGRKGQPEPGCGAGGCQWPPVSPHRRPLFLPRAVPGQAGRWVGLSLSPGCRRPPSQRRSSGSRASETAAPCSSPPAPRSSQPGPNGDPAGVGGMPESLIIAFVLIGISVGKDAHRPVERVPGAEIGADRDRVA